MKLLIFLNGTTFTTIFFEMVMSIIQYFSFNYIFHQSDGSLVIIIMYTFFMVQFILIILFVTVASQLTKERKLSTFVSYGLKSLSFFGICQNTVAALPFINSFTVVIICDSKSPYNLNTDCYRGIHLLHFVVALLGMMLYIIVSLYYGLLYIDMSPGSSIPFAAPQGKLTIYRWIFKVVFVFYITLDYERTAVNGYVIILCGMYFAQIVYHLISGSQPYNRSIYFYKVFMDMVLFYPTLCLILQMQFDVGSKDNVGYFYIVIITPIAAMVAIHVNELRYVRMIKSSNMNSDAAVEEYIVLMLYLINKRDQADSRILLEGILIRHLSTCLKECPCRKLLDDNLPEEDPVGQQLWYQLAASILGVQLHRFNKSSRLRLLNAYIQNDLLRNRFKALYELMDVEDLDIQQEFTVYRYKFFISIEMQDEDVKLSEQVDINSIITFYNLFVKLQWRLLMSVSHHHEFWRELQEDSPDCTKLQQLGRYNTQLIYINSQITASVEEVNVMYRMLQLINPNNFTCLQVYGQFQQRIINNDIEGPRLLEKAEQIGKSQMAANEFSVNQCFIIASCNSDTLGRVTNCNRDVVKILEYQKHEMIGSQLGRIMPQIFADYHDGFMRNLINTGYSQVIGHDRVVMALNKSGYMVPCTIMIKILPSLEGGLEVVSLLKIIENNPDEEKPFYILYSPIDFQIMGMTRNCYTRFGMPVQYIYGNSDHTNEYTLGCIVSDTKILEEKQMEIDKNTNQIFTITLDTTRLNDQFLIQVEQDAEDHNFKQQKVKCILIRQQYKDMNLFLLKFTEFDESITVVKARRTESIGVNSIKKNKKKIKNRQRGGQHHLRVNEDHNDDKNSINSVNSLESSSYDDMRALKDFKAMITEKTVPTQIMNLKITLIVLTMVLFIIGSVDLFMKTSLNLEFQESIRGLAYSYSRESVLSDITFYTRMANLFAEGKYTRIPNDQPLKQNISDNLVQFQNIQFDIIQHKIAMQKLGEAPLDHQDVITQSLLPDGTTHEYTLSLENALYLLINAGWGVVNSEDSRVYSQQVLMNGLYVDRDAVEQATNEDQQSLEELVHYNTVFFLVFMVLSLLLLLIAIVILIPTITKVNTTNSKVLSLFGLIPLSDIRVLADSCEYFLNNYIEEYQDKKNGNKNQNKQINPQKSEQEQQVPMVKENNQQFQEEKQFLQKIQRKSIYFEVNNEDIDPVSPAVKKSEEINKTPIQDQRSISTDVKAQQKKLEEQQRLEQQEIEDVRVGKLQASKSKGQIGILTRILMFFGFFLGYFVMQFLLECLYVQNQELLYTYLKYSFKRPTIIRYTLFTALEEVVEEQQIVWGGERLKDSYHSQLYQNERNIFNTIVQVIIRHIISFIFFYIVPQTFPSEFDPYMSLFSSLNYDDVCTNLALFNSNDTWCRSVQQGILEKGLRTAIVSLALNTQDTISLQKANQSEVLNGMAFEGLQQMLGLISPALLALNQKYIENYIQFIENSQNLENVKFSIFIIAWALLILIMWIPYLQNLSLQIWRTKGMLNMIPLSIIQKYERLKEAFLHSNILQMVK